MILEDLEVRAPPFSHLHNWWLPHKDQPGFSEAKLSWGAISLYPNVWEVQCSMIVFLVFINLYISKFYQLIYCSFWPFYIFYPYFGTSKTPLNTFMLCLEVVRKCVNQIDKTDCVKHQSNLQKLCRVSEPCKLLRPFAGQNLQVSTRDLGLPRASTLSQMAKITTPKHKIHKIHKIQYQIAKPNIWNLKNIFRKTELAHCSPPIYVSSSCQPTGDSWRLQSVRRSLKRRWPSPKPGLDGHQTSRWRWKYICL